ncbi:DUF2789 domain-containing protein [Aquabacterium sp. OR-4]|uniref:DUF2789 domain-containing protein n=1 Tax=Aquabacterium sp. OR-4 TaxID=2978127 RepID=UPI0028C70BD0|nr:DUF2789 domain-containing protein [Aquabacterium sp. OR-4]MDT7835060.1 DUF2789 domain-containing protein [Aquabacterium sp. OR-4]
MDTTTHHSMQDLFAQLGLPQEAHEIRAFVRQHRPLPDHLRLPDAPFWSESQAGFLREKIREDGDWAVLVDTLNAQLREHPSPEALPQAEAPAEVEGEGNIGAARRYNEATQFYVSQHDTAADARAAAPQGAREAAELHAAEQAAAAKARR